MFILQAGVPDARRAYEIIFVVVAFSVITQGGLVPALARRLDIPLRTVNPRPWGMNARFEEEPDSLHRFIIAPGSDAAGSTVDALPSEDLWISVIIHHGRLVTVTPDTVLHAGDEVLVLAEPDTAVLDAVVSEHFSGHRPPVRGPRRSARRWTGLECRYLVGDVRWKVNRLLPSRV
ncbi:TrkA C-terminal domain-containing protein [Nocardia terpenica]|uniref:RCK C-terminal domain-containing protein n=1 Tax=Nocardia terpenica TaxID=455432 RepID=A0A6G9Z0S0_9NOCA|nr:TrkA C-terminal domain-containing protein [Nocardia terpenica]QIS18967.1 hypothetical protein F6W96_12310 [Nocardia terpenica]